MNFALDCIFWRRILYFAFLLFTVALLTSPLYLEWEKGGVCVGSAC
ncbi:MAG: hypothetical protein GWO23_03600, partial [Gammaproteobacteria bacterium]|nr:hypothetical protein [Gammaproteobacteria bacterium]